MNLSDSTILITGASSGIGAATARRAAHQGATLALIARQTRALEGVTADIQAEGGTAHFFPADLSDPAQVASVSERVRAAVGVPTVVVNNAGSGVWRPATETSAEALQQMMAVPTFAAFNLTRSFAEDMLERDYGRVVNVNSVAGYLAWPGAVGYIAVRHALRGFTDALRTEFHGSGVGVSEVVLGTVDSPYWTNNPDSARHLPKRLPGIMPVLTTDDAAALVLKAITRERDRIVAPPVFRLLFLLRALFPRQIDAAMRR